MAIRTAFVTFSDRLDACVRWIVVGFLVVLVGLVVLQVVARYVFSSPPAWTEEMARYAMIWAGLLGATMSFKRRFDPVLFDGRARANRGLNRLIRAVRAVPVLVYLPPILVFCFIGANLSTERSFLTRQARMVAETVEIPLITVGIAVPVMIITILIHLVARWCEDRTGSAGPVDLDAG